MGEGPCPAARRDAFPSTHQTPWAGKALHPRTRGFSALQRRKDGRGEGEQHVCDRCGPISRLAPSVLTNRSVHQHLPPQPALSDIFIVTSLTRSPKAGSAAGD